MTKVMSLAALLMAALALVTPAYCQNTPLLSLEPQEKKAVKVPTSLLKLEDDAVCTLRWNGYPSQGDAAAYKFELRWGTVSDGFIHTANTKYNIHQLQPLVNGVPYQAQVRAVDRWGRASAWSPTIYFTGNSARVDAIRAQCSVPGGFFDDFNLPAGKPDWLKWNFAVNRYTDETKNGMFINDQLHAHIMMASLRNDRSQVVSRPRAAKFDLSDNGTRTVFFDIDVNPDGRDTWYLDFIRDDSTIQDISSRDSVDIADNHYFDPQYLLRLTLAGTHMDVDMGNSSGTLKRIAACDLGTIKNVYALAVPNVRRGFKATVSRTLITVYCLGLDGIYYKVMSAPLNLPWTRARLFNSCFGYNTAKNGLAAWLFHFDNFGFDAPAGAAPTPVVYDYKTQLTNGNEYAQYTPSYVIKIPDAVAGWKHRLFMTIAKANGNASNYKPSPVSTVSVNGQSFPIAVPNDNGTSTAIDLPPGVVVQGDNVLNFNLNKTGVLNIHIEATRPDDDPNPLPPYTPHCQIWGCLPMPSLNLGSDPTIIALGTYHTWTWDFKTPIVVSGVIPIDTVIQNVTCPIGTGIAANIATMEFQIDRAAVFSCAMASDTFPAVGKYRFTLDTTKLTNGIHELFLQTYTPDGYPGNPAYFEKNSANYGPGSYIPIVVDVEN